MSSNAPPRGASSWNAADRRPPPAPPRGVPPNVARPASKRRLRGRGTCTSSARRPPRTTAAARPCRTACKPSSTSPRLRPRRRGARARGRAGAGRPRRAGGAAMCATGRPATRTKSPQRCGRYGALRRRRGKAFGAPGTGRGKWHHCPAAPQPRCLAARPPRRSAVPRLYSDACAGYPRASAAPHAALPRHRALCILSRTAARLPGCRACIPRLLCARALLSGRSGPPKCAAPTPRLVLLSFVHGAPPPPQLPAGRNGSCHLLGVSPRDYACWWW